MWNNYFSNFNFLNFNLHTKLTSQARQFNADESVCLFWKVCDTNICQVCLKSAPGNVEFEMYSRYWPFPRRGKPSKFGTFSEKIDFIEIGFCWNCGCSPQLHLNQIFNFFLITNPSPLSSPSYHTIFPQNSTAPLLHPLPAFRKILPQPHSPILKFHSFKSTSHSHHHLEISLIHQKTREREICRVKIIGHWGIYLVPKTSLILLSPHPSLTPTPHKPKFCPKSRRAF